MKKIALIILIFALLINYIFAGKVVVLAELLKPETIIIDRNQILITQFPHVFVYSLKDFKLITKFGKAGEGPREFFNYVRIQFDSKYPQYICVGSHMKMSYYTRDGIFVKEIRSKTGGTANVYKPVGNNYAAYGFTQSKEGQFLVINLFDTDLHKIKEVCRWPNPLQDPSRVDITDNDLSGGEFRIYDNKIFWLFRRPGTVKVFDKNGEHLHTVKHDYYRVKVTVEDRKRFDEFYLNDARYRAQYKAFRDMVKFPSYFPSARTKAVADGKMYVLTNNNREGKFEFVIFDMKGKFIKSVFLPFQNKNPREGYPFTINYNKLFQLIDNPETEEWGLHITEIK